MEAKRSEYKGNDILQLWDDPENDKRPVVAFGLRKARAIVECIDDITAFVSERYTETNGEGADNGK